MNINQNSPSNKGDSFFDKKYEDVFYELYTPLCIYCLKIIDDEELAKDIVQDQFAKLWENWEQKKKLEALKPYLYTSVRNSAINYLNKKSTKTTKGNFEIVEDTKSDQNTNPQEILESKELEQILEDALAELPEKCKEIFLLKRFAELNNKEIAKHLNLAEKTVENQITIALKRISKYVKSNWPGLILLLNYIIR